MIDVLKTLWEKEKMLVTSIFAFSHNVFSSPEHEVLMVSYCDRAVSGVRRPSSTFYLVYALEATVLVGYS